MAKITLKNKVRFYHYSLYILLLVRTFSVLKSSHSEAFNIIYSSSDKSAITFLLTENLQRYEADIFQKCCHIAKLRKVCWCLIFGNNFCGNLRKGNICCKLGSQVRELYHPYFVHPIVRHHTYFIWMNKLFYLDKV